MTQTLDINGTLITAMGDKIPCKLVNISEKGFLELYCLDELKKGDRFQLVIITPKIRTGLTVTAVDPLGDSFHIEAVPEESTANLQAKIIEQKVRGLLR